MAGYGFTKYEAPEGYVYDYKEPRYITLDGEQIEDHLYCKYLILNRRDSIDNYKLVIEPKGENDVVDS